MVRVTQFKEPAPEASQSADLVSSVAKPHSESRGEVVAGARRKSDPIVSFAEEPLILVDEQDQILGYETKAKAHEGQGLLHRAFSIFLFNDERQLLMQQRSQQKTLWPLYWSNSCCSHPRRGEEVETAATRRLAEELGVVTPLRFVYKFIYRAEFNQLGAEYEMCSVFIGKSSAKIKFNRNEIFACHYVSLEKLTADMAKHPQLFTPWFKLEWECLREQHLTLIQAL